MSTQNFINGLNKMNFIKYDHKTFYTDEGFEVSYELELLDGLIHKNYPIQFQFYIKKDGAYVTRWGCEDNESNAIASSWVLKMMSNLTEIEYRLSKDVKSRALAEFKKLTE